MGVANGEAGETGAATYYTLPRGQIWAGCFRFLRTLGVQILIRDSKRRHLATTWFCLLSVIKYHKMGLWSSNMDMG